ncbi:hypothetical protein PPACK8108_LOCUS24493 [Phakopsora pachyrhizi]|uniref:Uncharacterized protein n=1 Tax=Phakopsora pachyrhizi TaxID=170000 RepID=A0AAV0BPY3_PHAPC|nr:hypothetical protein PPACK8108_LOCUS24493 [Phakopsora pachyrhizi]
MPINICSLKTVHFQSLQDGITVMAILLIDTLTTTELTATYHLLSSSTDVFLCTRSAYITPAAFGEPIKSWQRHFTGSKLYKLGQLEEVNLRRIINKKLKNTRLGMSFQVAKKVTTAFEKYRCGLHPSHFKVRDGKSFS